MLNKFNRVWFIVLLVVLQVILVSCDKKDFLDEEAKITLAEQVIVDKVKVSNDMSLLFEVCNNETYKRAKEYLRYDCEVLNEYFRYDNFFEEVKHEGISAVYVNGVLVDYGSINTESNLVTYLVDITVAHNPDYRNYYVIVSYQNEVIVNFKASEV